MRLTEHERHAIRAAVAQRFGGAARALLFGSRVDDNKRGGDIDLLIEVPTEPENDFRAALDLEVALIKRLGERKFDIVLAHPGAKESYLIQAARESAIPI